MSAFFGSPAYIAPAPVISAAEPEYHWVMWAIIIALAFAFVALGVYLVWYVTAKRRRVRISSSTGVHPDLITRGDEQYPIVWGQAKVMNLSRNDSSYESAYSDILEDRPGGLNAAFHEM